MNNHFQLPNDAKICFNDFLDIYIWIWTDLKLDSTMKRQ